MEKIFKFFRLSLKVFRLVLGLLLLCLPAEVIAEQPINIYTILVKERLSLDGDLGYNKLQKFIFQDIGDDIRLVPAPLPRSSRALVEDTSGCLYPASAWAWKANGNRDQFDIINSLPIDIVSARVYTKKSAPLITSREQLFGRRVGHISGQIGKKLLKTTTQIDFLAANSDESLLKLISRGRIDAILGFHPDTAIAMARMNYSDLHFSPDYAVFELSVNLMCHNTPKNKILLRKVNRRLFQAHQSGLIAEYLGVEAQIAPLDEADIKHW